MRTLSGFKSLQGHFSRFTSKLEASQPLNKRDFEVPHLKHTFTTGTCSFKGLDEFCWRFVLQFVYFSLRLKNKAHSWLSLSPGFSYLIVDDCKDLNN